MDISATVLKVPHHGSDTSSTKEFLKTVNPDFAVFSLGLHNRYDFPENIVTRRYNNQGINVFRTDLHGAITFKTDGRNLLHTIGLTGD